MMHANVTAAFGTCPDAVIQNNETWGSAFAVTQLACDSLSCVGAALAALMGRPNDCITIDARLASLWFDKSIAPIGWTIPPLWDDIAGDYPCADGWVRLHTNLPHHKAAALRALGLAHGAPRDQVAQVLLNHPAEWVDRAVTTAGGSAAAMRDKATWDASPAGQALMAAPLIEWQTHDAAPARQALAFSTAIPLNGLRVLDLTRVIAGPVATRTLAGFGADVLRIDPPGWDEAGVLPDVTLGKSCATLDLKTSGGMAQFKTLLQSADVLVHGLRPGALANLGLDAATRRKLNPALIDISISAYGFCGPFAQRRGFDSLVQMATGIAHHGMIAFGKDRPTPLPVQALDHATGYFAAAAALTALHSLHQNGHPQSASLSLARTGALLWDMGQGFAGQAQTLTPPRQDDYSADIEHTSWGSAHRLIPPLRVGRTDMKWMRPATESGSSAANWQQA